MAPVGDLESLALEAWLLASVGDTVGAIRLLAPTLGAQNRAHINVLASVAGVGALLQAMTLQARLTYSRHDRVNAVRWARAVATLWQNADPFLQNSVVECADVEIGALAFLRLRAQFADF